MKYWRNLSAWQNSIIKPSINIYDKGVTLPTQSMSNRVAMAFDINSCVQGHHVSKSFWSATVREEVLHTILTFALPYSTWIKNLMISLIHSE